MQIHFRTRLTLAALLATLAVAVGLSVARTSTETDGRLAQDANGVSSASSVAAAFPSVEAHFALRPAGRR